MNLRRNLESLYAVTSAVLICWFWCYLILKLLRS